LKNSLWALLLLAQIYLLSNSKFEDEFLWPQIEHEQQQGTLENLIQSRVEEIHLLNERWRLFASNEKKLHSKFFSYFEEVFNEGKLLLEKEGAGAAYFLYDKNNKPQFIIKPTDEDIFCLHNPKHFASPFLTPRVKADIPLYRAAQTDALCYEVAVLSKLENITPKTVLALVEHTEFSSIYSESIKKEKLCSIQEYLKGTFPLRKVLEDLFANNLSEEDLLDRFDQDDFEDILLFLWLTFDNDAHTDNFRVYLKWRNPQGLPIYGIKKIDNSLSFPEKNTGFSNALMYFPNALLPISSRIKSKILDLPINEIKKIIRKFGLNSSIPAFEQRMSTLLKLIENNDLSYYECSLRLSLLNKTNGVALALSDSSLEKLEYLAKDLIKISFLSKDSLE
jgi:hypothetical protein